ncbi:MAG TPA: MerR family transcriptional regulator [Dehalococcoidia bacterium]|jgi:MerR family transcriptional regulator, heat shock protein HspR|nr:MerR family transcriptional regulator [Dehalococcoidia bacterium]|tara:strand:+ start:244 stop:576 length:333 start_codon:yes stop_codon:yes gene_type:complete
MVFSSQFQEEPCFVISIAARMVGVHAQTLRYYERVGLIWPSRSIGKQRLYSPADIARIKRIKELTEDLGVNLAGAEIILKLLKRIDELEDTLTKTQTTLKNIQARVVRKS